MITTLLIFCRTTILLFLPLISTPLGLGLWILILALIVATSITVSISAWFSFILFLIYIGGLLVIFAYFVAIRPNKKINLLSPFLIPIIGLTFILIFKTHLTWTRRLIEFSNHPINTFSSLFFKNSIPFLIIIALSLLLILISVVKITNRTEGPLRPFTQK
jgi:NADH-ubiquinone oxidoreductase chain 6